MPGGVLTLALPKGRILAPALALLRAAGADTAAMGLADDDRRLMIDFNPRFFSQMAFDVARQRSVLFGGFHSSVGTTDRTHEWDGNVWVEASPSARPPARYQAAMAYDAARGNCVLFGGVSGTNAARMAMGMESSETRIASTAS